MRGSITCTRGSSDRGGDLGNCIVWKVNSGRHAPCVLSVLSELQGRLVTCVVGQALVAGDLSVVA